MSNSPSTRAACPPVILAYCDRYAAPRDRHLFDSASIRAASPCAREVIARQASGLRFGLDTVLALSRAAATDTLSPPAHDLWMSLEISGLLRLARLIAVQALEAADRGRALDIYRGLIRKRGLRTLPRRHLLLTAELAIALREYPLLKLLLPKLPRRRADTQHLWCDSLNPFLGIPSARERRWLELFNWFFVRDGVEPVMLEPVDDSVPPKLPFDRMQVGVEPGSVDGPLVTVMVSSWCPDQSLLTAIDSILAQSWRHIEVLLVDDASPEAHSPILEVAAARDPRIRLIRMPENAGTYVARNEALAQARGEYFTVHDSDDWAHPRRIELQMAPLLEDESIVATHCLGLRVTDALHFNLPGVAPFRVNESSLLFRTRVILEQAGFYDPSRKGADSEFSTRLRNVFGESALQICDKVLTVIRLSPDSLSRAEFKPGWRHPARNMYRRGFESWHARRLLAGGLRAAQHPVRRQFALPRRFLPARPENSSFDYVFAGDFRAGAPWQARTHDDAMNLAAVGKRVAILQIDSFMRVSTVSVAHYGAAVQDALDRACYQEIVSSDQVLVDRLTVTDPDVLQFMSEAASSVRARSVYVLAASGGTGCDGHHAFDPSACGERATRCFGGEAHWIARDQIAYRSLLGRVPAGLLARRVWPLSVHPMQWQSPFPRLALGSRVAVSLDARLDFAAQIASMCAFADVRMDVWIEAADTALPELADLLPSKWRISRHEDKSTMLAATGIWLHPVAPGESTDIPPGVVQALAAGCRVAMHEAWREIVGGDVQYLRETAPATDLVALMESDIASRELCDGAGIMLRKFGQESLVARIDHVLDSYRL